ncbi:ATP-binding cassette domain-containing protein [Spirosoma taeanense]|uniref:ATP-binding cassette domain-containing protein n=1 Tax=Spirosoma taeanense TaxID=2735870 RepID=A0A6M5Y6X2_9BACT|nr:ATP-binding cassette domain-containing protein [Spirosoma taeanense]QJW89156.1 ATP-binding cassette domain-containing protein [Spirosoma taeanense]
MISADLTLARLFAEGAGTLHVQITLATGSLTALVGASGSGKTTLLRLLAGLETPSRGRITVDDVVWLDTGQGINQRPQQRSVGYIFQDAALFPNLTVWENILFVTPKGQQALASELIEATGLGPFMHQKPVLLSGGQQQRVALARALVRRPRLLLLDEPFAALDDEAARQLRQVLLELHRAWGTTTVLVSHHEAEVQALADRVVRLRQGQIQSDQTPVRKAGQDRQNERINRVWFDEADQQWVLETDTLQLRSADSKWGQLQVGTRFQLGWDK